MSSDEKKRVVIAPRLRIVKAEAKYESGTSADGTQLNLFPGSPTSSLSFFHSNYFITANLIDVLAQSRPKFLFDFRPSPSFRKLNFDRREVLHYLCSLDAEYIDVRGRVGSREFSLGVKDPSVFLEFILKVLSISSLNQPIAFLFDDFEVLNQSAEMFPRKLRKSGMPEVFAQVFVGARK